MRIAHISDLHMRWNLEGTSDLPQRLSRKVPELLVGLLPHVSALKPDLLAVTGDLLDFPASPGNYDEALHQGRADLELLRDILDEVPCRKMVLPGNHDDFALAISGPFAKQRHEYRLAGHRVISFREDEEDAWHVPHRTGVARMRFEQVLGDDDPRPQVHLQHYLVWPRRNTGYPHTYAESADLTQRIMESNRVRMVLSGHYHAGVPPQALGHTLFAAVPAFCEAPHPIWVYDLNPGIIDWRQLRVADGYIV